MLKQTLTALLATAVTAVTPFTIQAQELFGEQAVNQTDFVAIASPGQLFYSLLILEQKTNARACWSESASTPVVVEPLLLDFDFSGICDRKTDSNGYAVRIDGRDRDDYRLEVAPRNGEIQLRAVPRNASAGAPLLIGRTGGTTPGLLKLNFQPGWRLTRRTYEGKALGLLYLSGDSSQMVADNGAVITPTPVDNSGFKDIANDIYREEIQQAVEAGFIAGFKDGTFQPLGELTREQIVSMVIEALDKTDKVSVTLDAVPNNPYPDVDRGRWSAAKIQWAQANGIVKGYPDGKFRPTQPVKRGELMAILNQAAVFANTRSGISAAVAITPTNAPFTFSDLNNHWSTAIVNQMSGYCKIATPYNESGDKFYPDQASYRNYAAAATLRMLNCIK
jgi:hypothetical protein